MSRGNAGYHQAVRAKRRQDGRCQRCGRARVVRQKTCLRCRWRLHLWHLTRVARRAA